MPQHVLIDPPSLMTPSQVGRALERSADAVVGYSRKGLLPCLETARGRLYRKADVDLFLAQRQAVQIS